MKKSIKRTSKVMIASATLPALAAMMSSIANAAPTLSLTANGTTAVDSFGDTATGYNGYILNVIADPGDVITSITAGSTATDTNGIFSNYLQDFVPGTRGGSPTSTPVSAGVNGSSTGVDTHFLTTTTLNVTAPFEDSNNVAPAGSPPNDTFDQYGSGTYLRGVFGLPAAQQVSTLQLAYMVLPKTTTTVSANIFVAEAPIGGSSTNFSVIQVLTTGGTPTPTPTTTVSLTSAAPTTGFGTQVGILTLTGPKNGSYNVATATFAATNAGYVAVTGFSPASDTEVYGLSVLDNGAAPTAADLAAIVAAFNTNNTNGTGGTLVASLVAASPYATLFPGDEILVTDTGSNTGAPFFAFNLSGIAGTNGALTANSISAVPEPASVTVLALGAAGLLTSRRRRQTV